MANVKFSAIVAAGAISGTDNILGVQAGPTDVLFTINAVATYLIGGVNFIVNNSTNNLFIGINAGNNSVTGTGDTAVGYKAGMSLTVPGAGGQPQSDTFFGFQAGMSVTTARDCTFIGWGAGQAMVGSGAGQEDGTCTFVGSAAGLNTTGSTTAATDDTFIGQKAGLNNIIGTGNTYVGAHAGTDMTTSLNTVVGNTAGDHATTSGGSNVLIGYAAGQYLQGAGSINVYIGAASGQGTVGNPNTGANNVALGGSALAANTSGAQSVAIGSQAGLVNTTGGSNVFVGYQAGKSNITGTLNVMVGQGAGLNNTGNANIFVGANAGNNAPNGTSRTFIAGTDTSGGGFSITDVYFGGGFSSATPGTGYTIHGTGGSGTNIAAGGFDLSGGLSTGNATNPDFNIYTGVKTSSGASVATKTLALTIKGETQAITVASGKALVLGNSATTGLTAGVLAALTNATIVISDSTGQAYRIPCII